MARGTAAADAQAGGELTIGEWNTYHSVYGYDGKKKASILKDGQAIGIMKAEPVMLGDGTQAGWAYYMRAPGHSMFFASPTEALQALASNNGNPEIKRYTKAKAFRPHLGDQHDPLAIDETEKKPRKKK